MGQGEGDGAHAKLFGAPERRARKFQAGTPGGGPGDLDLMPGNPEIHPGAQGFGSSLLGGKTGCKTLGALALAAAVDNLARGIDATEKTLAKALDRLFDPRYLDQVYTCPKEHVDHSTTGYLRGSGRVTRTGTEVPACAVKRAIPRPIRGVMLISKSHPLNSPPPKNQLPKNRPTISFVEIAAWAPQGQVRLLRMLYKAICDDGGWVLHCVYTRLHSARVVFEFPRDICVDIYSSMVSLGLELSPASHLIMADLCRCTPYLFDFSSRGIAVVDSASLDKATGYICSLEFIKTELSVSFVAERELHGADSYAENAA